MKRSDAIRAFVLFCAMATTTKVAWAEELDMTGMVGTLSGFALLLVLVVLLVDWGRLRLSDMRRSRRYLGAIERTSQGFSLFLQSKDQEDPQKAMEWLLRETARTLDVSYASFWAFDAEQTSLKLVYCFDVHREDSALGLDIKRSISPRIFEKLEGERCVAFDNVAQYPVCEPFVSILPEGSKPRSILIAMIGAGKQAKGILLVATQKQRRRWSKNDRQFAGAITDLIAFYLSTLSLQNAQSALSESEERFRNLVDAGSDWYWETDDRHCFTYFSDQFGALTGIDPNKLLGQTRSDIVNVDALTPKWSKHWDDLQNHRTIRNFQYTAMVDGREISVTINGKPFFDDDGLFLGYRGTGSDITESAKFRIRFEEGINALPNGFLMWDAEDRLVMWNSTILEIFPAIATLVNRSLTFRELMQICNDEDLIKYPRMVTDEFCDAIVKVHKSCGINEIELTNGRYLMVNEQPTSEGGIVGIYTDITALKARERELLESKRISEVLSSSSNILFHARNESFIISEICRIVTENFPFEVAWVSLFQEAGQMPEYLKINAHKGLEVGLTEHRPSSSLKQVYIKQDHLILNESSLLMAYPEFFLSLKDAKIKTAGIFPIFMDTRIAGFLNVASKTPYCFNESYIELIGELANDVGYGLTSLRSEHSRLIAEEALRESESRYRSLVDMSPDAILVLDETDKIVFSNPEGHVLFGSANRSEILGKAFPDFQVKDEDLFSDAPKITDDDPTQFISSVELRRFNDNVFEADITARPVSYAGLTTRLLIIRDVTERNRVNEHLAQTSKLATLGEMAAGITHELSQPLNIMRFAAEGSMLKMQRGDLDQDEILKKFDLISMQSGRMADIIDHMRVFSRKDTGELELFDPTLVIRQSVDMVETQFLSEGIHLDVRYPSHYGMVKGRPIQLEQVILNLINNARDAINQRYADLKLAEGELKKISVFTIYDQAEDRINIAVTDNGGGIPEEALGKLFDPFFTTKEVGKGTGLGLSVSYGIIAAMGGTIRVRNIHKGARFDITLPCCDKELDVSLLPTMKNGEQAGFDEDDDIFDFDGTGAKVLVVDDEIYAVEAMTEFLFEQGYQVNMAGDGEEALELYEMDKPDVVVTDMRMPRMDGSVLIRKLKALEPNLPVIVVTGHIGGDGVNMEEVNKLAFCVLKKPVSLSDLSKKVAAAVQSKDGGNISTIED